MTVAVPQLGDLGTSLLFGNGNDASTPKGGELLQLNTFVSSEGKAIELRCKQNTLIDSVDWKSDESYGVNINELLDRLEGSENSSSASSSARRNESPIGATLWTEKWRPKGFLDLVGNERTNRRVLRWLRQWSPLVFNEQLPKLPYQQENEYEQHLEDQDPLQRPRKKILLIHGPPGIGKTSVAHVVAKQAGYTLMEINASDERAGTRVRDKVHNALFNHTFNDKPVCLVADEIDGSVENGFIRVLIDILANDTRATQQLLYNAGKKSLKKSKYSRKVLTRPVIAICNNAYASALDKLKPHCEIVAFKRPSEDALQERLELVCSRENLDIDKKTLKELAELSQGDVRNCLNNLQFISSGVSGPRNTASLETDDNTKDITVSWFRIVNQIFKRNPHKEIKLQFKNILRAVETNSNYDKIVNGCFTMYPEIKYSDNGVNKPGVLADWLYFNDMMFKSLFEHNGELLRYSSLVPMAFFQLFSDIANKDDSLIKSVDYEVRESIKHNFSITGSLLDRTSPRSRVYLNKKNLILEVLPYMDYIITFDLSKIRSMPLRQSMVDNIVPVLKDFGLTLEQRHDPTSRSMLCIQPPLDEVTLLDEKRVKEVATKRPGLLNFLLAKVEECEVKKRTIDKVNRERLENEENRKRSKTSAVSTPVDFFKSQYSSIKTKSSDVSKRASTPELRRSRNFISEGSNTTTATNEEKIRIWVKYKEGFSNAVRKNVNWETLWQ